jgi:hypothetical protein
VLRFPVGRLPTIRVVSEMAMLSQQSGSARFGRFKEASYLRPSALR